MAASAVSGETSRCRARLGAGVGRVGKAQWRMARVRREVERSIEVVVAGWLRRGLCEVVGTGESSVVWARYEGEREGGAGMG